MRVPRELELSRDDGRPEVVRLHHPASGTRGLALWRPGHWESDYDVVQATRLGTDAGPPQAAMAQVGDEAGAFEVTGVVTLVWDDGLFAVEAYGFDFWVGADEVTDPAPTGERPDAEAALVSAGEWFRLQVRRFTIWY